MAQEVPDIFIDQFKMFSGPYSVVMIFSRIVPPETKGQGPMQVEAEKVLTLRMSLEHAKKMTMIMGAQLHDVEENVLKAPIPLPPEQPPVQVAAQSAV